MPRGLPRGSLLSLALLGYFIAKWVGVPLRRISQSLNTGESSHLETLKTQESEFGHLSELILRYFEQQNELRNEIEFRKETEDALRLSENQLRESINDRSRLAQDLHDGIIQSIYAIGLRLENSLQMVGKHPEEAVTAMKKATQGLNIVIADVRNFITGLEPESLKDRDLKRALENLISSFKKSRPCDCVLEIDDSSLKLLDRKQTVHLFHIAHELRSNSVRHAKPNTVTCRIYTKGARVIMEVVNDGGSFPKEAHAGEGKGLKNVKTRVAEMNAFYGVGSEREGMTRMSIEVPVMPDGS